MKTARSSSPWRRAFAVSVAAWLGLTASAQTEIASVAAPTPMAPPEMLAGVTQAINAPYLNAEEQADIRVFHGVWTDADLEAPARRARAALLVGVWDDPVFDDAAVPVEDRAEARLLRGDLQEALDLLVGASSVRSRRLRAQALEMMGRFDEADAAIDPVVSSLLRNTLTSAEDLVEGVRALTIRTRVRGEPASNYQQMMSLLAKARDQIDRLYWPAHLAEARLLYDKDNSREARDALMQTLAMNPRCAEAWSLLGQIAVDGFNMDLAAQITASLNELAVSIPDAPELGSPWAALVIARAQLRQNDPDGAAEALDQVIERLPRFRPALAMRAAAQAVRYDYDGADAMLHALDELSPGSPLGHYHVGRALSEARQYEVAAKHLNEAARRQPNWPPPLVELGLLELQAGRDHEALTALRQVAKLDPFQVRAANSLELIEELLGYETVESDHFIVRFKPGIDRMMAEEMLAPLEENHAIVAGAIEHEPDRKTIIELMPDHRWFAVRITGMPAIHTIAASTGPVIAMEAPKIGLHHTGEYDWVRVIRHEYVHTVTLSRTNNRIPHWFTEAAAVYLELAPRDYSTCQLLVGALTHDALFDMDEINIAFVRPKKPSDRSQAYAQGHWMYEYIVERFGPEAPLNLMDLYAQGVRERQAMASVFGIERDQFIADFKVWAREQAKSWGMLPEPRVEELLLSETLENESARAALAMSLESYAVDTAMAVGGAALTSTFDPPLLPPSEPMVDRWLQALGDHPDALELKIGFELRKSGGEATPEIAPLLERYAAARPVDPSPHRLLAQLYLASDDPQVRRQAIEHLEYLDAREQRLSAFSAALARLYAEERDFEAAGAKAERATTIAPFDANLRELAARVALLAQDLPRARRHIAALVALEPDRPAHAQRLERIDAMMQQSGE